MERVLKSARESGSLNLSNRSLRCIVSLCSLGWIAIGDMDDDLS
jgi:hypothetical protein